MSEWSIGTLPDFADLLSGCTVSAGQFGHGIKYITVQQLYYGNTIDVSSAPRVRVSNFEIERYQLIDGDILIGKSSVKLDGIGYPAWFKNVNEPVIFSNFTVRLRTKLIIDQSYLFYWLRGNFARKWVIAQAQQSALTNINQNIINRFPIHYPKDLRAQKKIALILDSVDQAIEKTEALIEKYQQIKAGLMHDLFTRGIGADGKLRPSCEQAPELYQETPIGWIPKEWKYSSLYSLLAPVANNLRSGPFGSALLKAELSEDGIPFLGIDNIHVERFDRNYRRFVSDQKFNSLIKYAVRPRDVVITIMGTVGRSAVIPSDIQKALSSKHLWTMTFDTNTVVPELLCWQLNYSPWVLFAFRKETQGGIMDAIQSKTLKNLLLPLPPFEEQELILNKYNAVTERISSENDLLIKLRMQKSGLMHDLLTGKVRVPVDLAEAAHV